MKKLSLIAIFVGLFTVSALAQPAANYYDSANNKSGNTLRLALQDIIDNHTVISYDDLEPYYKNIDYQIDNPDFVWDIYSNCNFTFKQAGGNQSNVCDCWNKEHTVPQSWFSEASPMKSDLYHVLPTDARVNNFRGSLPYGVVSDHSSPVCNDAKALGWVEDGSYFEPVDEFKGDIARIYFYMATRYANNCSSWSGGMFGNGNEGFVSSVATMLLNWHKNDPVSQKEINRSNGIQPIQGNRNPFVDYPDLAYHIWGDKKTESFNFAEHTLYTSGATLGGTGGTGGEGEPVATHVAVSRTMQFIGMKAGNTITIRRSDNSVLYTKANCGTSESYTFAEAGTYMVTITVGSNSAQLKVIVP